MPTTIKEDTIDGGSVTSTAESGLSLTRRLVLSGVEGTAALRLYNALADDLVPGRGDEHPEISDIYADEITATGLSQSDIEITIRYRFMTAAELPPPELYTNVPPQKGLLSIGSTLVTVITNKDSQGKVMWVDNYVINYTTDPGAPPQPRQVANANIQIPMLTARFVRREAWNPNGLPSAEDRFVGTVNGDQFLGLGAGNWLMSKLQRTPQQEVTPAASGGKRIYLCEYEFQLAPPDRSWFDFVAVYIDPKTNKPPSDIGNLPATDTYGTNGIKKFTIARSSTFSYFGLI